MSGHRAQRKRIQFRRWGIHQRLFTVRHDATGGDHQSVHFRHRAGICDGAILRAKVTGTNNPKGTIEPFSWGYRNPYGIRFAPHNHPLRGGLFVTENGEDERGARPTNNAPDRLALAQQNPDGTPDYHGQGGVQRGAALVAREGDFGFSFPNGEPEAGHDIELVNFNQPGSALALSLQRFAFNKTFDQAFPDGLRGINRPTNLRFGPDACAYLVDYGAVRDFGKGGSDTRFLVEADAPLVQIPGTGVIWKICKE